ncbi:FtsW/RodA/SpoVE family cell cycle protein [Alistipes sp.]|uniref:FtsW/RodA/SpoVE family cell cycle protein n=1 Tax=Alistipes sp. TaxID=1872444 RepID=UPI003A89A287
MKSDAYGYDEERAAAELARDAVRRSDRPGRTGGSGGAFARDPGRLPDEAGRPAADAEPGGGGRGGRGDDGRRRASGRDDRAPWEDRVGADDTASRASRRTAPEDPDAGAAGAGGRDGGASRSRRNPRGADPDAAEEAGRRRLRLFTGDRVLWIIIAVLAVISVLVVYSSTAKMAYDAHTARSTAQFLRQQLMILGFCLLVMIAVQKINCRVYNQLSRPVYYLSVGLTLAVYFIGATTNGAARWFPIGSFQFQPSEALKVATVLFLARQLAGRQSKIDRIRIVPSWKFWTWRTSALQRKIWREGTWPILMPVLVSCLVIFPAHTSSAVLVFLASWVMMLIGRVRFSELLKLVGWAAAGVVLIMTLNLGRSETAEGRVSTWIHLWTRSQTEKPIEHLTDTERSMIAIHNGGIFGEGAGQSAMRVEMIHPESDYAYAFFVEEYGIILAVLLLMLYLWIFFRAIEIFRRCGTAFPGLLVLGLALLITCQALLHIMVTVNLIPETGQTLPLISRGGSSVLFTAIALGMILSVSRQNDEQSHDRPKSEELKIGD